MSNGSAACRWPKSLSTWKPASCAWNKIVAVQDCGLIIDMKTAESQVYGALIMGICYALFEERIMDQLTGRMPNANMEFYKLAGIGDIGELVVHMMTGPGYDERGIIGLGEPPVISPGAAISNAVANAIGVRVPTPADSRQSSRRARQRRDGLMEAFEYANPTTKQALGLLGPDWDSAAVLAGGTDLISLDERRRRHKRVVSIKGVGEDSTHDRERRGLAHRRRVTFEDLLRHPTFGAFPAIAAAGRLQPADSQHGHRWWLIFVSARAAGISGTDMVCSRAIRRGNRWCPRRQSLSRHLWQLGPGVLRESLEPRASPVALGAQLKIAGPQGERDVKAAEFFMIPKSDREHEKFCARTKSSRRS